MNDYDIFSKCFRKIAVARNHFNNQIEVLEYIFGTYGINKENKILDAACGTGDVVLNLSNRKYKNLFALDGSQAMLQQFVKKIDVK